jgi:glucose/arabinose dehydrogenase
MIRRFAGRFIWHLFFDFQDLSFSVTCAPFCLTQTCAIAPEFAQSTRVRIKQKESIMKRILKPYQLIFFSTLLVSCDSKKRSEADLSNRDTLATAYQEDLVLPAPHETESTVKYSKVVGWPENKTPLAREGFTVSKFVSGIKSPRNIYVADNGDIFVAFANTESKGIKKKVTDEVTGRDESQHTQNSLNQIHLFRDEDGDGTPEIQSTFLTNLNQPFGMLVLNGFFYVANTDGIWRYPYTFGDTVIKTKGEKILDLPAGGYNNHWTRNLLASRDGSSIYVAIGSASDHGEYGMDEERERANILEINPDGSGKRVFAGGLRNPVGMDLHPETNTLWTVVNERDELGDDLVPDYLVAVEDGTFYGWPYAYFGPNPDPRIKEDDQKPELVKATRVPDLAFDAHSSSMGLVFVDSDILGPDWGEGALVTQHGSWNRSSFTGYRVLFVPFRNGRISGPPRDFITGFIANEEESEVYGRPVAVAVTKTGSLLMTDDASDTIWKITSR